MTENPLVLTELREPVAVVFLNRPEALNALSPALLSALCVALERVDADPQVRAIVLAGKGRAFAAGADIKEMASATPTTILERNALSYWQRLRRLNKPLIAAVSGYAYGGGCELALQCDLIVASETARFAQPEIKLGIIPGAGGTQRLARALGPYRAMEMILTGEPITAPEAYAYGLVNRLVPPERCLEEALALAMTIAARPSLAVRMAREAVRYGFETTLREGLEVERRNYTLLYDTEDQKEGMAAFLEKRPPKFRGK
jgi:enoyl-CoA hydratase